MSYTNLSLRAVAAMGLLLLGASGLRAQEAPSPVRGDVDGDGRVTRADADAVRAWLVRGTLPGGREILPAGDANGDGRVTAADAALISRFVAGVDVSRFPVGRRMESARAYATTEYECLVDLSTSTTECHAVGAPQAGGARLDLLPGTGPLSFAGSWTHSRGSTVDEDTSINTLRFVNNLGQPIGTTDGSTPSAGGNRLFFTTAPYVASVYSGTVASASINLVTPDGTATFTNPENTLTFTNRPYYQYDGIVEPGDTSTSRQIRYIYSASVKSFIYKYRVSTPVQYEYGYITVPPAPALNPAATTTLTGTVYDAFGVMQADGITWSTSNPSVATVNASTGQVTAVAVGTATITATSTVNAQRIGSVVVTVTNEVTWEGDVSSDWQDPDNWSGNAVPDATSEVTIPAGTPNQPVLTQDAEVLDITLEAGSTLGLAGYTLDVYGSADAAGTISGGIVQASGSNAGLQGSFGSLEVMGGASATGAVATTGPVSITGSLNVADQTLTIAIP